MLGPLLFDNGIGKKLVSISPRSLPSLSSKPQEDLILNSGDADIQAFSLMMGYDKENDCRKILREPFTPRHDLVLGSAKKIFGGAFCGHAETFQQEEHEIVQLFVEKADCLVFNPGKDVSGYTAALWQATRPVVEKIRAVYEAEVDTYLTRFAGILADDKFPLRWNLKTNNCQHFAQNLLHGMEIGHLFHRLPPNYFTHPTGRYNKHWPCLRYLLSSGWEIDTPLALLRPQDRSLLWRFYHHKRDYHDLIEFAERPRHRAYPASNEAWVVLCGQADAAIRQHPPGQPQRLSASDALWTIPRDSPSILQTHLMRSWARYSSPDGFCLTREEWTLDRLRVLDHLSLFAALSSGLARALIEEAGKTDGGFAHYRYPLANLHGTLHVEEAVVTDYGALFVTGSERDRWKREVRCIVETVKDKIWTRE